MTMTRQDHRFRLCLEVTAEVDETEVDLCIFVGGQTLLLFLIITTIGEIMND